MVRPDGRGLVFILSTPRSGSTLLAAILGAHRDVLCPSEPWFLLPLSALHPDRGFTASIYEYNFAQAAIRDLLGSNLLNECIKSFAMTAYNTLLRKEGKRIFVDKTPRYYHILRDIDAMFPNALKIWLRRNPLDIISSYRARTPLTVEQLMGQSILPQTFDVTVGFTVLASYFERDSDTTLSLKYEDLVDRPHETVHASCDFLQIPFDRAMINYGDDEDLMQRYRQASLGDRTVLRFRTVHDQAIGAWRDRLTKEEIKHILWTLGASTFRRLGYLEELEQALAWVEWERSDISEWGQLRALLDAYVPYGGPAVRSGYGELLPGADQPAP